MVEEGAEARCMSHCAKQFKDGKAAGLPMEWLCDYTCGGCRQCKGTPQPTPQPTPKPTPGPTPRQTPRPTPKPQARCMSHCRQEFKDGLAAGVPLEWLCHETCSGCRECKGSELAQSEMLDIPPQAPADGELQLSE